jgi:hypothetical protein
MTKRVTPLVLLLLSPLIWPCADAWAQKSDAQYCGELSSLAQRYVSGSGGEGRSGPDLNTLGAIQDCQRGRYDKGIPYLEKRLRDSRVTLPSR